MKKSTILILLALLTLFAAGSRLIDLSSDPPTLFSDASQDFTTDGGYLTLHSRNAVRFGSWDLFGDQYWRTFKISIVSVLSFVLFSIGGVSRTTANLTGSLLNLSSLMLFVITLAHHSSRRRTTLISFFLATSFLLCTYGRIPFSENGLLFLAALLFCAVRFWSNNLWGKLLIGVLAVSCGLLGKAFGFLLILPALIAIESDQPLSGRITSAAKIVTPALIFAAMFIWIFYSDTGVLGFLVDRSLSEHGALHALSSPGGYLENLISYAQTGLHRYSPVLSILGWLALLNLILFGFRATADRMTDRFMLSWILIWIVALALFNYRPIRYQYLLIVPLAWFAGSFLDRLLSMTGDQMRKLKWPHILAMALLNWYASFYVIAAVLGYAKDWNADYRVVWYSLPLGLALTAVVVWITRKRLPVLSPRIASVIVAASLLLSATFDATLFGRWYVARTQNIAEANRDLADLVGPSALITGQYAPALCADTDLKCYMYLLRTDPATAANDLKGIPVTHLAVIKSDWNAYITRYPELAAVPRVASFWLRDNTIYLLRVTDLFPDPVSHDYRLSDFEKYALSAARSRPDSASLYLDRFLSVHPMNKTALLAKLALLKDNPQPATFGAIVNSLATRYPTDFWVDFVAAVYYKWRASTTDDLTDMARTAEYLERAVRYNPRDEDKIRSRYQLLQNPAQLFSPSGA